MTASVETRGRTDNAQTSNDEERRASGNVFRRLGRGSNIRDTLNRRREHESSQYSTTQKRQQKADSQGIRNVPIKDLWHDIVAIEEHDKVLIAEATKSPFCREIREARLLEGFKVPTIKAYKGKSDPQNHLDHFNDLMELHLVSAMAKCKVFTIITLNNGAKKWLKSMTPTTSWQ